VGYILLVSFDVVATRKIPFLIDVVLVVPASGLFSTTGTVYDVVKLPPVIAKLVAFIYPAVSYPVIFAAGIVSFPPVIEQPPIVPPVALIVPVTVNPLLSIASTGVVLVPPLYILTPV
jgi:hypothetical protein